MSVRTDVSPAPVVDRAGLEAALRARVRGEVRFTDGDRAIYSTDASNYRQIPLGIVVPRDRDDVIATVAVARAFGAPVVSRGGGTSLAGETCNVAVVIDFSKYLHAVVAIDWEGRTARVEPGCVLDDLRNAAEARHLTFGPDPATHDRNTLGGMIGNNSCGMHAQMAGKVEENVEELEILTYDGIVMRVGKTTEAEFDRIVAAGGRRAEIYGRLRELRDRYADRIRERFPKIPRLVSGYPLHRLLPENGFDVARALVGTESTCVTILEATVRLVESPPFRTLTVFGFADISSAADAVAFCTPYEPIALEGLDASMFAAMAAKGMSTAGRSLFPRGDAWLIVEFGGDSREHANANAKRLLEAFAQRAGDTDGKLYDGQAEQRELWEIRENGLGATSKIPGRPDLYPGWEDSAVPPDRLGDYLRDLQTLLTRYGYSASLYGHFGQGCVHGNIDFDLFTADGIATWLRFLEEAARLVTAYGGSLSGEHGDGQARGALLPIMFGDELVRAFREFKAIWDPSGKMNPGKVVDPYPIDINLRWGTHYQPWEPATHFAFGEDRGSFAYAANRCVGTGKCRKHGSGVMCPSYMATREEKHSTRGRARLLFEMLEGDPLGAGWQNEEVKDALDLCLACKGCKRECPVNVDMATYKAEFLSHYYEHRRRPIAAYAFGLMYWWARAASYAPQLVNAIAQAPLLGAVMKAVATVAPQRRVPLFASQTFGQWFARRPAVNAGRTRVVLWVDTWNNHFHPTTVQAAVEVLEAAGFAVVVPAASACCGRPLYDYGMLDLAKTTLIQTIDVLRPYIRDGLPIVGLEPSCISVFRDEMVDLLHGDDDAKRLRDSCYLLGEFLVAHAPDFKPPPLAGRALVQPHCHHRSVLRFADDETVLQRLGLELEVLDAGCCGMAGAFGFERAHYDVSLACGERVLLPRVRAATPETLVVGNGFSCREQIAQTTDRRALHLAEVLKMALDGERLGPFAEREHLPDSGHAARRSARLGAALLGLATVASVVALVRALHRRE